MKTTQAATAPKLTKAQREALKILSQRPEVSIGHGIRGPVLASLRARGLVSHDWNALTHGTYWSITNAGRAALKGNDQ